MCHMVAQTFDMAKRSQCGRNYLISFEFSIKIFILSICVTSEIDHIKKVQPYMNFGKYYEYGKYLFYIINLLHFISIYFIKI